MSFPRTARYVVVGAGIHGLSTAYHLAKELESRGLGSGADILVLEKTDVGAGASGIACGVVRNNYFQPAMSELMQACVEVWESDPEAFSYNPVGYIALGPAAQEPDLVETFERQERIGYRSELVVGEREVDAHMKALFPDWRAQGVTICLHERQGGFAFNRDSVAGLELKALADGARIVTGEQKTEAGQLEGRVKLRSVLWWGNDNSTSDRTKLEWVVEAPSGGTVGLEARHERAGTVRAQLNLSA